MINHTIFNIPHDGEIAQNHQRILVGMGCFWGVERCFWKLDGVIRTAVGYAAGHTENPTYAQICTGETGHAEVVEVIYDAEQLSTAELLKSFWENHDPTQGMRQGNDRGTQYRSMIVCYSEQQFDIARQSCEQYQSLLSEDGRSEITTELLQNKLFNLAEEYHQQYLDKNPQGYCNLGGTGTCFKPL